MFEHHENYDRYIPDVMLKKHKKHEEYLNDVYAGMSHEEIYKSKLGTKTRWPLSRAAIALSTPSMAANPVSSIAICTALPTALIPTTLLSCGPVCTAGDLSMKSIPILS